MGLAVAAWLEKSKHLVFLMKVHLLRVSRTDEELMAKGLRHVSKKHLWKRIWRLFVRGFSTRNTLFNFTKMQFRKEKVIEGVSPIEESLNSRSKLVTVQFFICTSTLPHSSN